MKSTTCSTTTNAHRRAFIATASLSLVGAVVGSAVPRRAFSADLPHLTLDDPTASALGYTENSAAVDETKFPTHKAGMACANCNFFQGGAAAYGACQIYSGKAVNAKGWCSGYAPKA